MVALDDYLHQMVKVGFASPEHAYEIAFEPARLRDELKKNIGKDPDPSLILHQRMLTRMIEAIGPGMVHVNGISAGRLVDKLYCRQNPLKKWGDLGEEHNLMFGHASFGSVSVPVMTHNQFGWGGPKARHWPEFAAAWREWRDS